MPINSTQKIYSVTVCKFMNIIAFIKMKIYLCRTLKAIHNKDYSVVKTFKAGLSDVTPKSWTV